MRDWFLWIAVAFIAPIPLGIGFLIGLPLALLAILMVALWCAFIIFKKPVAINPDAGKAKESAQVFIRRSADLQRPGVFPSTR